MALLDSYLTAAAYRALVAHTDTSDDAELLADTGSMSRILDDELGLAPGAFNASAAAATRYFDGTGRALLELRDSRGRLNPITTIDAEGIRVDTTGDGTFDTTFDLTEAWAVGEPYNAVEISEPFTALRLLPISGATASVGDVLSVFPVGRHNVALVGTHGWSAVPDAAKRLTAFMTRDLRDRLNAGASGTYQVLESGVVIRDDTWRTLQRMKQAYTRKLPAFA